MGGETASRTTSSYPKLVERPVGKQIQGIYTDRLRAFTSGGQYEKQYLRGCVRGLYYDSACEQQRQRGMLTEPYYAGSYITTDVTTTSMSSCPSIRLRT